MVIAVLLTAQCRFFPMMQQDAFLATGLATVPDCDWQQKVQISEHTSPVLGEALG